MQSSSRLEWEGCLRGSTFAAAQPWQRFPTAVVLPAREPKWKRWFDIVAALIGLLVFSPFLVLAAIAIKLESPGPILFRQGRMGCWRRPFQILKLRSMRFEPHSTSARWTRAGDHRITRVGRFLRRIHLDEAPQFWNVLKGEMSLVGPRPEQIALAQRLARLAPYYHWRHTVRPGITGWAQVNTGYCDTDEESLRKLEYDLFYVQHASFRLDLEIAFRTVAVMLTGRGSR